MNGPTTSFTEMGLHRQVNPYSIFPIAWPVVDRNLSNRTRHINIITIKGYSVSLGLILKFIKLSILPKTYVCPVLSKSGANAHFAGYTGWLSDLNGPLAEGFLNEMLIDSWECHKQSWTPEMKAKFKRVSNYSLWKWLPALFGYVIKDHETTSKFLTDWCKTLSDPVSNNSYGQMTTLTKKKRTFSSL
jgi:hypothetical protein